MIISMSTAKYFDVGYHIETSFVKAEVLYDKLHHISSCSRYSSAMFKDGKRSRDSFDSLGNLLIYDVDNDRNDKLSLEDARRLFSDIQSLIVTTKSHQIKKNEIVEDRYRILLPLDNTMDIVKDDYSMFYLHVASLLGIEGVIDTACKDIARMYQPCSHQKVFYSGSVNLLNFDQLNESFEMKKALDAEDRSRKIIQHYQSDDASDSKDEYLRSIFYTDKFLALMKTEDNFVPGNRNRYLYSCGSYLLENGIDVDEVRDILFWVNDLYDGIAETELERTVMRSLKL